MPIPEDLLHQMKCCLNNDDHIVNEPILLTCGSNACQKCIQESKNEILPCFGCNQNHRKKDYSNATINKIVQILINSFLSDLLSDLNRKIKNINEDLKGKARFHLGK